MEQHMNISQNIGWSYVATARQELEAYKHLISNIKEWYRLPWQDLKFDLTIDKYIIYDLTELTNILLICN